jgi:uncharacterized membrane protein HdeD (DUF308 family)
MESYENEIAGALAARWWTLLVRGLAAVLFGILAIARPGASLLALVFIWGSYTMVDGVFELVLAAQRGSRGGRWGWYFFEGIVSIAAGAGAFAWPGITVVVLATMIGAWALLTGIAEIVAAIELRKALTGEWLLALSGVVSIVFGLAVFAFPMAGALSMVWLIGIYAIAFGTLLSTLAFRVKHWAQEQKPAMHGGTPHFAKSIGVVPLRFDRRMS